MRGDGNGGTSTLDARYGRRTGGDRTARRVVVLAAVLLVAATLVWSLWVARATADRAVSWQDVGFAVEGDDRVRVTFDLRFGNDAEAGDTAVCTLRALNEVHAEVGLRDVSVRVVPNRTVRAEGEVATSERAVTGLVKDCALGPG